MLQRSKVTLPAAVLALLFNAGCGSNANGPSAPLGAVPPHSAIGGGASSIQEIAVSGQATFPDGTAIAGSRVQLQLILDGADLFHPGPGGCTETPAHVAGTVIETVVTDSSGAYSLNVPIAMLRAAVVRQCALATLQPSQVEGLRIKATILANADSCATYCSATGDPSAQCVSDCSTGNRTIDAADSLGQEQVMPLLATARAGGTISWSEPLSFAQLGPELSTGAGPDLVVDAAAAQSSARISVENFTSDSCEIAESCVRAAGSRTLLRFDGTIENLGSSDLVIGDPTSSPLFQNSSCHHVPLLSNIMLYELIDPSTGAVVNVDGQDIVGRKQGFCMMDITQINASAPEGQYNCDYQGITAGWADVYDSDLECQYLDITDVPSGDYTLRLTVNPDGIFQESDTSNNTANIPITIPAGS